jgi:hypothetical protein
MTAGSKEISKLENENIVKEVSYLQITDYCLPFTGHRLQLQRFDDFSNRRMATSPDIS